MARVSAPRGASDGAFDNLTWRRWASVHEADLDYVPGRDHTYAAVMERQNGILRETVELNIGEIESAFGIPTPNSAEGAPTLARRASVGDGRAAKVRYLSLGATQPQRLS